MSAAELTSGVDHDAVLEHLRAARLEITGRLVEASNATLFGADDGIPVVYKPIAGERPLWDFPDGTLAGRELSTYLVSRAAGWDVVPPTVLREGPFGPGMVQLWIDEDPAVDIQEVVQRPDDPWLRRIALLDAVANNTDRKGGHILPMSSGAILGCDHGLTFHREDKLRTVLWQWRGMPLTEDEQQRLEHLEAQLAGALGTELSDLLTRKEILTTQARVRRLLADGSLPWPSGDWPAVPWPPF